MRRRSSQPAEHETSSRGRQSEPWLDGLTGDLRGALRRLRHRPVEGGFVVAILALCLGVVAAAYVLVDTVLLRPLDLPEPERVVRLWETHATAGERTGASKGNLVDFRDRARCVDRVAGWYVAPRTLLFDGPSGDLAEVLPTAQVSTDFFEVFGVEPVRGRTFTAEETARAVYNGANSHRGTDPVVVISHRLWQRLGAPEIPGAQGEPTTITIDRQSWRVLGVLPDSFDFPVAGLDLWIPWSFEGRVPRDQHYLEAAARLAPGSTIEQARAELDGIAADLAVSFPDTNEGWGVLLEPLDEALLGDAASTLALVIACLAGLVGLAAIHLAGLQRVRMLRRTQELAVRLSLGATRAQIFRSLLVEALVPVVLGALAAVPIAWATLAALRTLRPANLPRLEDLDALGALPAALGLPSVVALFLAVVTAVLPAWLSIRGLSGVDLSGRRDAGRSAGASTRWVAAEVALTLALLVVAAFVATSWLRLLDVDSGFDAEGVYVAPILLDNNGYGGPGSRNYYRRLVDELAALPEVEAAGGATVPPLATVGPDFAIPVWAEGAEEPAGGHRRADVRMATPGYFETLRVPVLAGRAFDHTDDEDARSVVVVNQALADHAWPGGESPVGRTLFLDYSTAGTIPFEVVGVVGSMRGRGPRAEPRPEVYLPHAQRPYLVMNVLVRSRAASVDLTSTIRAVILRLDPAQPAHSVQPLAESLRHSIGREREVALFVGLLGACALALAALGIYGRLAIFVAARRREIGIRQALGAEPRELVRWVVGLGLRDVALGLVLGLGLTLLALRAARVALERLLYGIDPADPWALGAAFCLAAALLLTTATVAGLLPARHGARVDPVESLREA